MGIMPSSTGPRTAGVAAYLLAVGRMTKSLLYLEHDNGNRTPRQKQWVRVLSRTQRHTDTLT
jgi:hypothetical protein